MFKVENADFIADKLASELLPNQEFREVLKNSLEAVVRRMRAGGVTSDGRVEFDVDWYLHGKDRGAWYLSCTDNGDGMSRSELERYTTTLAVQGAGMSQSLHGNQGMGLKISGPTRHKRGIFIRSLKGSERTMVQVGWNGREYGLIPVASGGEKVMTAPAESFSKVVVDATAGTVVTFLGNSEKDNTFVPDGKPKGWLLRYLNSRFFRLSHDGIEVAVRVPVGDVEEWPHTPEEAAERMRGKGRSFNLTIVRGTASVWDDAADKQGANWRGVVGLKGDVDTPAANVHWWVLPVSGSDVSSRTVGGGSLSVLYDNELHDWRSSTQANPFFARMGVLFGKNRIAFVLEPKGREVTSDFARAHVLVSGRPVFEANAWLVWSEQFRQQMPDPIVDAMAAEQARLEEEDPDRSKRIRDRLKEVLQLLRPRRFRKANNGDVTASGEVTGGGGGEGPVAEPREHGGAAQLERAGAGRGIGALLGDLDDEGEPAVETTSTVNLEVRWVDEVEADSMTVVNGEGGLRDRAGALAGADGRTAGVLLLNREFRGYRALLGAVNEWANPEGDTTKAAKIEASTREWIEQKMIEAVLGLRQLENGKTWLTSHYDNALSPVGLTAVFMADRYHTMAELKKAASPLRAGKKT